MVKRTFTLVAFITAAAFGHMDSNSVTVSVNRESTVQPDQAIIAVYVNAGVGTSFNDVVAAVQSAGITAANLSGVRMVTGPPVPSADGRGPATPVSVVEWAFGLAVPLSKVNDTLTALTKLQTAMAQQNYGLPLAFGLQGTQISPQLQLAQTCSTTDLLADARAQAQKLADAAALTLGPILALASSTSASLGYAPTVISRLSLPGCSVTVKFGLTRY